MKAHRYTRLAALLLGLALAGCGQDVLDFRNAEVSQGKLYKEGANKPFSGKVTNVPHAQMPKAAWMNIFLIVDKVIEEQQPSYQLGTVLCDAEFDQGLLDGDVVCTLRGLDEPFMTMKYEKGSLEGTMKVASYKTPGVTLAQATYRGGVLDGQLIVNHPDTGALVNSTQWRAGKLHGAEEGYSLKTGKLSHKATYVDGRFDGEFLQYGADGKQVIKKVPFVAGKRHGVEEEYSPEGQLIQRKRWTEDLKDGLFEEWNPQGQLVQTQLWNRGIGDWPIKSPSQQATGQTASAGSLTGCVDGWTAAFRKENGDDAMVTMDQLGEWEAWCREGKVRP